MVFQQIVFYEVAGGAGGIKVRLYTILEKSNKKLSVKSSVNSMNGSI